MLTRVTSANGVVYYVSPLLAKIGVPHAFSTRVGGVSAAPFDSLNLGNPNGCAAQDEEASIELNYSRLQAAAGFAIGGLGHRQRCWVHQVHGPAVIWVDASSTFANAQKADALATGDPTAILAIRVADCVPVLLSTFDGHHVAAAHAGWRGVVSGVVPAAAKMLIERSGTLRPLVAAIGPSISAEAFEVGPEVADEFKRVFGERTPVSYPSPTSKPHVDLRGAIHSQLLELGVADEDIDTTDRCTVRDKEEFYSHRRDNGVTGRMAALIGTRLS